MAEDKIVRTNKISDQVYELLRGRILSGRLAPMERLRERTLATQLGVSPTPIREALVRLEQDRMIESQRTGGARVRQIPPYEVAEILDVRAQLEGSAAAAAARFADAASLEELTRIHETASKVKGHDSSTYRDLDVEFHRSIVAMSKNLTLARIMGQLQDQIRIVMIASMQLVGRGPEVSHREHADILDALRDRDPERAERLAREHVERAKKTYLDQLASTDKDLVPTGDPS